MGRNILQVTLRLADGRVIEGVGRNLPATVERVYNQAFGKQRGLHAVILEHLPTGHAAVSEHRYEGTFHGGMADDDGKAAVGRPFVVETRYLKPAA